jgi:DNA-binding IscR family transcriptional regulator
VLARKPEKISLLDIIMAIQGSTFEPFNFIEGKPSEPFLVKMKEVSNKADSEIKRIFTEATVAEMIGNKKK